MRMMDTNANPPVRAILVDDEPLAIDALSIALDAIDAIEVVATCADGEEAVDAIRGREPDLVFLDVQMPGLDGFDVIERIGVDAMPEVVFVTAYDEHALRAFEVHAADYVLKPFDDERFADSVRHAIERVGARRSGDLHRSLAALLRELPAGLRTDDADASARATRLLVRNRDRMRFIDVDAVDYFEAAGNYVRLHVGDASHLIRSTLGDVEARVDARRFVRIHRSTIVNVDRIREVQPWGGGDYIALLDGDRQLRISRTYRDDLLKTFG